VSHSAIGGPIAVVDVETTGLFPMRHDRVVEVAVVLVRTDGRVEREFVSLVNPHRDIGPTSIHGLTAADIAAAPQFHEIAPQLVEALRGAVAVAGHNVRFDRQFLQSEFSRMGRGFPDCFELCTLQLAGGGRLADCCESYGIQPDGDFHDALTDARATARLLTCLLAAAPGAVRQLLELQPVSWPSFDTPGREPVSRNQSRTRQSEPPTFLQRLRTRLHEPPGHSVSGAVVAYADLLDRVLEDRHIDAVESDALFETATLWGLTASDVESTHRRYLQQLASAALADGIVTNSEQRDLQLVARLLGLSAGELDPMLLPGADQRLRPATAAPTPAVKPGARICFTGELQCFRGGERITREQATSLATDAGMLVVEGVTKALDILVVADPQSQSGKAKKARQYGVRVLQEAVFWQALGVAVD
jgi:DNA polymerase-3 subunit epsilon